MKSESCKVQKNKALQPSRAKIDVEQALKLRLKGLSMSEIGRYFNVTPSAVHQRLHGFNKLLDTDISEIMAYEANKGSLLTVVERELLIKLLDSDKLKSASLNNIAYAFQQIFNANRLTRGQSTQNISYQDIGDQLQEIENQLNDMGVGAEVIDIPYENMDKG